MSANVAVGEDCSPGVRAIASAGRTSARVGRVRRLALLAAVAACLCLGGGSSDAATSGFSAHVTNPWFPLPVGRTLVYRGEKDGKPTRDVVHVTSATKTIAGAPCAAISDQLYSHGHVIERTTDWYTQDARGNVWYYGEDTAELDAHGHVTSREGTWQAGRDGAKSGIFMPAHPKVGIGFRQEYYKGHAEDHFRILSLRTTAKTPAGSSSRAMLTKETTPLEPGVVDHKYYIRGLGTVLEETVKGGSERNALVSVRG